MKLRKITSFSTGNLIKFLENRPEIIVSYLLGSQGSGTGSPLSDIDIGILVDKIMAVEKTYGYRAELSAELISCLKNNQVDVVILNEAPPLLAHRVVRDGIILHCKSESERTAFEVKTFQQYVDTAPLPKRQMKYLKKVFFHD